MNENRCAPEGACTPCESTRSTACGVVLLLGAFWLTSIAGEAGENRPHEWLAVLAGLTLVWLISLGSPAVGPARVFTVAIGIRLAFLLMPTGSDTYRYLWEGRVLAAGFNPYLHPPDDLLLTGLRDSIWQGVGHPDVTAIYPPLAQWLFAALAALGSGLLVFKLIFTAADLILCFLLIRRFGAVGGRIYAWNPLAALSFAGGGHYDSLFMLAMVLAWFAWDRRTPRVAATAVLLGTSIAFKWMALPLGLWLVVHLWRKDGFPHALGAGLLVAAPAVASWALLCAWTGEWTLQLMPPGFSRAARSAELIPAITDFVGGSGVIDNRWFFGALLIAWGLVAVRSRDLLAATEWSFFATYLLSPMLHAWYFVWLLPFAAKSRNPGSIALAASGIAYFLVHITMAQPGGQWTFSAWERTLIWAPFTIGFLVHRQLRVRGHSSAAARESRVESP